MPILPQPLVRLVEALGRLPTVGPKTAMRMAVHLLGRPYTELEDFARTLLAARRHVGFCPECGFWSRQGERCAVCEDAGRTDETLLVVEAPQDVAAFERMGRFHGRYHVLGGLLSPLDGIEPEALRLGPLWERLKKGTTREVVLALDACAEGEATTLYLSRRIREVAPKVRVTRIAQGLPVGGDLEYADEATLLEALSGRRELGT